MDQAKNIKNVIIRINAIDINFFFAILIDMKNTKKVVFILIFALLGLLALQIPVSKIIGSSQSFSFFDFFAPTIGAYLNSFAGMVSVFLVKLVDLILVKKSLDAISLLRLLPLPLAAFYFGSKSNKKGVIGLVCMFLFIIHPVGKQVWAYSLYWLIPIFASLFPKRLFLKSLGSTFTAHAVGSIIFLYTVKLPPQVWKSLIPIVFMERVSFTIGIYLSYFIFNLILNYLAKLLKSKNIQLLVNKNYLPSKKFLLKFA